MGVELGREVGPELLLAEGAGVGGGLDGGGDVGKGVIHADDVFQKNAGDVEGVFVIVFPAGEGFFEDAVFHHPEGGEDHGDAEGDKAQAADGGDDVHIAVDAAVTALGKDIVPGNAGGKAVEDESAEKTVFCVRDEV